MYYCTYFRSLEGSLQQGRYTTRHDTVLCKVNEALKTFILNIKEAVPISAKSSIKFVKKGTKVPCVKGLLHLVFYIMHLTGSL